MENDAGRIVALAEERLKLEREAFELERERFAATKARMESELNAVRKSHPILVAVSVMLLALFSFVGGVLLGESANENRHQQHREARLKEALTHLETIADSGTGDNAKTNASANGKLTLPGSDSHRNVSVVVIQ